MLLSIRRNISWHHLHSEAPFILGVEVELVDK